MKATSRVLLIAAMAANTACASGWVVRHERLLGRTDKEVEKVLGKADRTSTLEDKIAVEPGGMTRRTRTVATGGPDLPLPDWSGGDRWDPGTKDLWCWGSSTFVVFAQGICREVWAKTGLFGFGELQLVQIERTGSR